MRLVSKLQSLARKELRIGYNSEFFQLYPFLTVTDDIADAMIYASHMIYASRMKTGTDIILIFAPQIYHTCKTSISYSFTAYIILLQQYIIDKDLLLRYNKVKKGVLYEKTDLYYCAMLSFVLAVFL